MMRTTGTYSGPSLQAALVKASAELRVPVEELEHETLLGSDAEGHVLIRARASASDSPAESFVRSVLAHLSCQADVKSVPTPDGVAISVTGPQVAALSRDFPHLWSSVSHLARKAAEKLEPEREVEVEFLEEAEDRDTLLGRIASVAIERCRRYGRRVVLPPMNPYERRLVHLAVREHSEMATESIGSGRDRRIMVIPFEERSSEPPGEP